MGHDYHSNPVRYKVRSPRCLLTGILLGTIMMGLAADSSATWNEGGYEVAFGRDTDSQSYAFCSDQGGGQSFIATCFPTQASNYIMVKKYSRTGVPLWGAGGVVVPRSIDTVIQAEPLRIAGDFQGGVYVGFREMIGTQVYAVVVRLDSLGHQVWRRVVGNFQMNNAVSPMTLQIVPDDASPAGCFVVWAELDQVNYDYCSIRTAYLDAESGTPLWNAGPLVMYWFLDPGFGWNDFLAARDGLGGFLVTTCDQIQRLDHQGNLLFGSQAVSLWNGSYMLSPASLVPDESGGAYVLVAGTNASHLGYVIGQHVDASGTPLWPAEDVLQYSEEDSYEAFRTAACPDGAGGLFFVTGLTRMVAQWLDGSNNRLWGEDGLLLADFTGAPGYFDREYGMAASRSGNPILLYRNGNLGPGVLGAMQLDGSGATIWRQDGLFWRPAEDDIVTMPRIVTDGWDGAAFAFLDLEDSGQGDSWIGIGSLGPDGSCPPLPVISYLNPPWTEPGQGKPLLLHGQYLDPEYCYRVVGHGREYGLGSLSPVGDSSALSGVVDLSGTLAGPYGISVWGVGCYDELAGKPTCLGVSPAPDCFLQYETRSYEDLTDQVSYGRRSGAVTAEGIGLQAFLMKSTTGGDSRLQVVRNDSGSLAVETVMTTGDAVSDVVLAAPSDSDRHYAYIRDDGLQQYLVYRHNGAVYELPQSTLQISWPALAVNDDGQVLIVFQGCDSVSNCFVLKSVEVGSSGFGSVVDLNAGCNAVEPDLVATGTNFMVTYTRDMWIPGAREVCYQAYDGTGWNSPESLNFGWNINCPAVAWDGSDDLLFSYVLDNYTGEQVLFTNLLHLGTLEPARRIKAVPLIAEAVVLGGGDNLFHLMTACEYVSGYGLSVEVHNCDDKGIYPPDYLGQSEIPFLPTLAGNTDGQLAITWNNGGNAGTSYDFTQYRCSGAISAVADMPARASALAAYPNPFNPSTTFAFALARAQEVTLAVYDLQGARVRRLHRGHLEAGPQEFTWNGRDESGRQVASGVYFARLTGQDLDQGLKIVLIK